MENEVNIIHDPNVLTLTEDPYVSIQGEAQYVGIPMLFVRIQGCPVGCDWCDSYYTWYPYRKSEIPEGIKIPEPHIYSADKLKKAVEDSKALHVWFTGGEPMIQADAILNFLNYFKKEKDRIFHICTSGIIWKEDLFRIMDNITVDVKGPSSGIRSNKNVLQKIHDYFNHKSEFKMVVANTDADRLFALKMITEYPDIDWTLQPLYISEPELVDRKIETVDIMMWELSKFADWVNDTFRSKSIRMGLQLHKHLYPNKMRGI